MWALNCIAGVKLCDIGRKEMLKKHLRKEAQRPVYGVWWLRALVKPKFLYLTHSKAKQTELSEFGAEKGLLQGQSKENGQLLLRIWWGGLQGV